jgi:hypothetical protein
MGRGTVRHFLCAVGVAALAAACSGTTNPNGMGTVSLSLATGSGGTLTADVRPAFSLTQTSGSNTLVIDSAQVVLRKVELEAQDAQCTTDGTPDSQDGCEEFESGPTLVSLPLDGSVEQMVALDVPAGSYSELKFQVHAPTADSADQAFLQDHPGYQGVSILVGGTFNGADFVFTTNMDVQQEKALNPPLVVDGSSATTNVTLSMDVSKWFMASDGSLIDPSTANLGQPNEGIVKSNIQTSMNAFKDQNENGVEDSAEGGS